MVQYNARFVFFNKTLLDVLSDESDDLESLSLTENNNEGNPKNITPQKKTS